ncbi:MAG: hypothetical protein WEF28_08975 [Acidimicrobiia bacterium]
MAKKLSDLYVAQHGTTGDMLELTAPSGPAFTLARSSFATGKSGASVSTSLPG